jgi:predicted RNA binding protein YcfA (HicA-like mRNA interferase family)
MSRLTPIRWRELVRRLRALGFEGPYQEGRHPFMVRRTLRLRIPNPHGEDIGAGLVARLLRDGGIAREEWESMA